MKDPETIKAFKVIEDKIGEVGFWELVGVDMVKARFPELHEFLEALEAWMKAHPGKKPKFSFMDLSTESMEDNLDLTLEVEHNN